MGKRGILLINVGSPESTSPEDVGRYLKQFLMDPEIISLPTFFRYLLVHFLIVPRRKFSSAKKYELIWSENGSPLIYLTQSFAQKLQNHLGSGYVVSTGMRYGRPSIREALEELRNQGVEEILVSPLFPQYARATVASGDEHFKECLASMKWSVKVKTLPPFYASPEFIDSYCEKIREAQGPEKAHYVFSFHGLPEKQIRSQKGCLESSDCCAQPKALCYRSQCLYTAKKMAEKLNLNPDQWTYSFQSRLGPKEWIKPYTDDVIQNLRNQNKGPIYVACPSFVTDCLETLEEIGTIDGIKLIPCPNDSTTWVKNFGQLVKKQFPKESDHSTVTDFAKLRG